MNLRDPIRKYRYWYRITITYSHDRHEIYKEVELTLGSFGAIESDWDLLSDLDIREKLLTNHAFSEKLSQPDINMIKQHMFSLRSVNVMDVAIEYIEKELIRPKTGPPPPTQTVMNLRR